MYTDSTSSRSGEIPEIMKWTYRIFLLHHGYVLSHKIDFNHVGGMTERYEIIGHANGSRISLTVIIDRSTGIMGGRMERGREVVPVYEIGSLKPVEFLGRTIWKTFGEDEQDGQAYKKVDKQDCQ